MKKIQRIWGIVAVVFLVCIGIHIHDIKEYNDNLKNSFEISEYQYDGYRNHVPMEDMDMNRLDIATAYAIAVGGYKLEFTLDKDIYYYVQPDKKSEVVYVLNKGDTIVSPCYSSCSHYRENRFDSLPTYERGWRYALPMLRDAVSGHDLAWKIDDPHEAYAYLSTDDMQYMYKKYVDAYCDLMKEIGNRVTREQRKNASGIYLIDNLLYEKGIYLSPDLYKSYWDGKMKVMVFGLFGMVLLFLVCGILKRKRR